MVACARRGAKTRAGPILHPSLASDPTLQYCTHTCGYAYGNVIKLVVVLSTRLILPAGRLACGLVPPWSVDRVPWRVGRGVAGRAKSLFARLGGTDTQHPRVDSTSNLSCPVTRDLDRGYDTTMRRSCVDSTRGHQRSRRARHQNHQYRYRTTTHSTKKTESGSDAVAVSLARARLGAGRARVRGFYTAWRACGGNIGRGADRSGSGGRQRELGVAERSLEGRHPLLDIAANG